MARCCRRLSNHFWLILWILVNCALFIITYHKYQRKQYEHLYAMLGKGLCVARASAAMVNLSAALVLLPVCRGLNSLAYRALARLSRSLLSLWLSSLPLVHATLAVTIVLAAVIHSSAHLINAANFSLYYDEHHPEVNWAKFKGQSPLLLVLSSTVGLTGFAMLIILLMMLLMSLKCMRDKYYDLFWATHFLFLPFMGFLILHPLSGVLKEQKTHQIMNITCMNISEQIDTKNRTCNSTTQYYFAPMECQGWLWVLAALIVFAADSLVRLCRRNQSAFQVSSVVHLAGGITQLTLTTRKMFKTNPGQYVLLQCPSLSSLEWHPFTITEISRTSSHSSITVLIRRRGDWTEAVSQKLSNMGKEHIVSKSTQGVRILVDGPFSSPMEQITKSKIAICIAAGIGITPFMSVFQHLYHSRSGSHQRPHRLHLVWVVRTPDQLSCAAELIAALHRKFWYDNQPDRFYVVFYVTRRSSRRCQLSSSSQNLFDKRIHSGRPVWQDLFSEWSSIYYKKRVLLYSCGSEQFTKQIENIAQQCNSKGAKFTCIHEAFS